MLNIEQLRDEREQGFNEWFKEWWNNQEIEELILERNAEGFTNLFLPLIYRETSEYEKNRLKDPLFIKKIRAKLIGFKCTIQSNVIFNSYNLWISWAEEEESDQWN